MADPTWMHADDPELADGARARLQRLPKSRKAHASVPPNTSIGKAPELSPELDGPVFIDIKNVGTHTDDDDRSRDLFKWAVLYENQRGLTMFSIPYYSNRSLLPYDPAPFTVPDPGPSSPSQRARTAPPNVTPATYTLPDPTWRWVSKVWLVDMGADGDVQHDGFEYNWYFRQKNWRARVGWFSAGGFVRRRRWVRLMMRPSEARRQAEAALEDRSRTDITEPTEHPRPQVWRGDGGDWPRVHAALKDHARDGPRLELWAGWLAHLGGAPIRPRIQGWTEDGTDDGSETDKPQSEIEVYEHPPREWVLAVIRVHAHVLSSLFIYPDSRARLYEMFLRAGLVQDIFIGSPSARPSQLLGPIDFWSNVHELELLARVSTQEALTA